MRPMRRRRPAGRPQVPNASPSVLVRPAGPAVVRLGVGRTLVDLPWGLGGRGIANVWPDPLAAGVLARAWWPWLAGGPSLVAPQDLQVGHVIEVHGDHERFAYGWVADVDERRIVLAGAPDASAAIEAARRALSVWQTAELARVEEQWRDRIRRAQL